MKLIESSIGQVQGAEMLYRFALDCAENKINSNCDNVCINCADNLELYDLPKRDALLLMHTAELEISQKYKLHHELKMNELRYSQKLMHQRNQSRAIGFIWLIFLAIFVYAVYHIFFINPAPRQFEQNGLVEQRKEILDRTKLLKVNGPTINSFLKKIDASTDGKGINDGIWNKLYACIATVRNIEHINYWVYTNYLYNYDVHTREVWPYVFEEPFPIGELNHGHSSGKNERIKRAIPDKAWRYDRQ
jgi:hypothetical protein